LSHWGLRVPEAMCSSFMAMLETTSSQWLEAVFLISTCSGVVEDDVERLISLVPTLVPPLVCAEPLLAVLLLIVLWKEASELARESRFLCSFADTGMTTFDPANPNRENLGVAEYGLTIYHELSTGTVRFGFDFGCDGVGDTCSGGGGGGGGVPSVSASATSSASTSTTTETERMDGPADAVDMCDDRERERELPLMKLEPGTTPKGTCGVDSDPRSNLGMLMVSVAAYIAERGRLMVLMSV